MLKAVYHKYLLNFKTPGGTSRGVMNTKKTYFVEVWDTENPMVKGWGEAALFEGLSCDDVPDYEQVLGAFCNKISEPSTLSDPTLKNFPSIRFALETALSDLNNGGKHIIYPSAFTQGTAGIKINGLIWMENTGKMMLQIEEKLKAGFECLKLKISEINFSEEYKLISLIRSTYASQVLEIRVDANGAFSAENAMQRLELLAKQDIHSIEQPIRQGQWLEMSDLCLNTPLPIALDEELIGLNDKNLRNEMLEIIRPQYIILKPALIGGFSGSEEWIELASHLDIGWWITSALESNIGLNAIAQYTFTKNNPMPQGLGTGQVFTNNIPSPLALNGQNLYYSTNNWELDCIKGRL